MDKAKITYEVSGGVATLALDDPDTRNALSDELLAQLVDALRSAREDDDVRCLVLTSTHETVFSSGGNLAGFAAELPLVHKHVANERFPEAFALLGQLGKPSVCAANGHVLAGALGLALACDLIVAHEDARFGTPEINVGLFPFMIMALIYRNVGRKKTAELMLLGEQISATEAQRRVRRRRPRLGRPARREVPAADAARQGRDVSPGRHGARRRGRVPARAAHDRALHAGHPGGRARIL
jgi:enoyl-CoA hydratase